MNKILSILISMLLIFNIFVPAFAQESSNIEMKDISNHWAEEVISKWVENKLITGYTDGTFKPDANITKAEFLIIVNRTFGFNEIASNNYSDVLKNDWYYDTTLIAKENKYMDWYQEKKLNPDDKITRQEVCAIIASIHSLKATEGLTGIQHYMDNESIPDWSKEYIDATVNKGYLKGYEDNTLRVDGEITRAEAVVILDRVVGEFINKEGTYGPDKGTKIVESNLTINTQNVVLQNIIIKGDLILAAGIQEGEVDLDKVIVEGKTIINGGGENSITFNSCELGEIIVFKANGKIRVVSKDSEIGKAVINSGGKLEGEFKNTKVEILGEGEKVTLDGDFDEVKVESQVEIEVTDDTKVDVIEITNKAKGTKIDIETRAVVNEIIFDEATEVTGKGKIKKAKINADGVKTEQEVDKKIVSKGKDGSGVKEKKKSSGGSSSGGSSGGGSTTDKTVPIAGNDGVLSLNNITPSSVTVNWTKATDNKSGQADLQYVVYYSESDNIRTVADVVYGTKVGEYTADVSMKEVTGLTEDKIYYFNVIVKDEAGNKSAYVSNSVKTAISEDREAPIAGNGGTLSLSDITPNSITVNWTKATDDRSAQENLEYVVYYSENDNIRTVADVVYGTKVGEYTADINMKEVTGLSEKTTYYFNVLVKDEAGNKTAYTSVSDTTIITADTTAPTVVFTPADATTDVSIYTNITITFNEAVRNLDNSTLENSDLAQMITLKEDNASGADVTFSATIDSEKKVITITPNPGTFEFLKYNQDYYVSIASSVEDSENNAIAFTSATFTTEDGPIATFSPVDGTTDVEVDSNIIINFSKPVRQENDTPLENGDLAGRITFRETDSSGAVVAFTATIDSDKKIITIDPNVDLKNNQTYYVAIARSVEDYDDNLNHATTTTFTTVSQETIPPVVGNVGMITTSNVSTNSITLNWTKATDNITTENNLEYQVYRSESDNIDTVSDMEANGTVVVSYAANITTKEVTGLTEGTTYYFNVIVKDEVGNKSAYTVKEETTLLSVGTGTEADPFKIRTIEDLAKVGTGTDGWGLDKHYILLNDLDFESDSSYKNPSALDTNDVDGDSNTTETFKNALVSTDGGKGWKPIQGSFSGKFWGDSKTINNLYINRPDMDNVGLFASSYYGVFYNVDLRNIDITGKQNVGGLIGYKQEGIVEYCDTSGQLVGIKNAGLLIGTQVGGTTKGCSASGNVSGETQVGGVIGVMDYKGGNITFSMSSATVSGTDYVGGLVGQMSYASANDCYTTGDVTGTNYVGGITGYTGHNYGGVSRSYAIGKIEGGEYVGGLVGQYRNYYGSGKWLIAFNNYIAGTGTYVGRVTGHFKNAATEVYANENMTGIDVLTPSTTGIHGGDMSTAVFTNPLTYDTDNSDSTLALGWEMGSDTNNDGYYWEMGKDRPVLYVNPDGNGFEKLGDDDGDIVIPTYTVSFESNNGTSVNDITDVTIVSKIAAPTAPTKTGFEFGGWYKDSALTDDWDFDNDIVVNDLTLYAKWTVKITRVESDGFGGYIMAVDQSDMSNPIGIWKIEQLDNTRVSLDENYILMEDIDFKNPSDYLDAESNMDAMSGWVYVNNATHATTTSGADNTMGFQPIGNDTSMFTGTFDGNGNSISNLFINRDSENYIGLFGVTSGSGTSINNLTLENIDISGNTLVGGLVGANDDTTLITKCNTNGTVEGYSQIGGLVGRNFRNGAMIKQCYSNATVTGDSQAGGLVGRNERATIYGCYATGNITGTGDADSIGGLVGRNYYSAKIDYCYATGNVTGKNALGGLVGMNRRFSNIYACYATGNVNGNTSEGSGIGGIVGYQTNSARVDNSYATGNVIGNDKVGGLVGNNSSGAVSSIAFGGSVSGKSNVFRIALETNDSSDNGNNTSCYAFESILVDDFDDGLDASTITTGDANYGPDNYHGTNITAVEFATLNFYTNSANWNTSTYVWDFDGTDNNAEKAYWKINSGTDRPVIFISVGDGDTTSSDTQLGNDNGLTD